MEHTKYTVQIPLTITISAGPDDNPYDIYESALDIVDHFICNSSDIDYADVSVTFDVFNVVNKLS